MSNTTRVELFCPLLQNMQSHSLNNREVNWAVVCLHGLFSCLGILENALILWVIGFRLRKRTVASVWVLNLAMSDFLATLTLPLFTTYLYHSNSWELGKPLCKIQASIFFLNMFVSAFLLAAISLDRFLLVVKPVWCQNHRSVAGAWKVCALAWLWAVINTAPYTLFRSVSKKQDGGNLCYHNFALILSSEATLERDCKIRHAATAVSKLLLAFLFPLVVIAGSYIKIGLTLRKRSMKRKQSTIRLTDTLIVSTKDRGSETATTKTTNSLASQSPLTLTHATLSPSTTNQSNLGQLSQSFIKMVTFVITAFVLCWAPYHIFCMIEVSAQYWTKNLPLVERALPLATTIAFLNPVLNPILYAFSCPHFCVRIRQSLGSVFATLVEEEGGLLMGPGKSIRAHIRRKSSRDGSTPTPGSPKSSLLPSRILDIQPPSPSEDLEDLHIQKTELESKNEVNHK